MIAALFLNPGFIFIAAALISVPIIIHLINRMRFKRIRWAAMEFLLKAQKRTRRRLIIEQLLLLALRCLLLALVGLLVSRFIGCSDANMGGRPNLHLVILDDTLSMQDTWKHTDGAPKNAFDVAKTDFIIKKIAKGVSLNKTNDVLMIIPLSKINDATFEPKEYVQLNDKAKLDALTQEVNEMQPSMLHVDMLQGVKTAERIMTKYSESTVTLHVISDYRHVDWSHPAGEGLTKQLLGLAEKNKDVKIRLIDTVHPPRAPAQAFPPSRDNVGIVDFRASTRVVGKKMPVHFTVVIQNFSGKQVEVNLEVRNEVNGKDMQNVDFSQNNPIKLSPSAVTEVTFDYGDIRHGQFEPNDKGFAHLSVRLLNGAKGPLDNDGLLADNIRHTVVEVRDRVPILIVDGLGADGRKESKDSYILSRSLESVPGGYEVQFGDLVATGASAKALERADLSKYPTIYLVNVQKLTEKQTANLETFVKEGGGVGFFMGPLINNVAEYNKNLYKQGKGIFPAPLKQSYPAPNDPELPTRETDTFQLITRDDQFPGERMPIFGAMFDDPRQRMPFRSLPIHRYFKVDRAAWKPEKGRVLELATLPNENPAVAFDTAVAAITVEGAAIKAIRDSKEFSKYRVRLDELVRLIIAKVQPGTEFKAYQLAEEIDRLLNDKGEKGKVPDMTELWASSDPSVATLQKQLTDLREQVYYGDPFVIAQTFGKGRVVAIMSTAGKDWNEWCGGSLAQVTYPMFIWEMQNYLSSPGAEGNLMVGTNLEITLDAEQFQNKQLRLVRNFIRTKEGAPAEIDKEKQTEQHGKPDDNGKIVFALTKNNDPGVYLSKLYDDPAADKPIAVFAHAFNVDTLREGNLQRVGSDDLERELLKSKGIKFVAANARDDEVISKTNDFSESPWLFLILLLVLVAEQALAVHLSFHLKNTEDQPAPAGAKV